MDVALVVIIVEAIVCAAVYLFKDAERAFEAKVQRANTENSLSFPLTPILGNWTRGLLFDRANKKVLFIDGSNIEVLDYGYFTSWIYLWDRRRNGAVMNRLLVLDTVDFDRPRMIFGAGSDEDGQTWVSRLDVLFNRE